MAECSSKADKPVIVRVKRKAFQSPIDAFWLEINERPLKRPLLDFGKLSISDSPTCTVEEAKTKKILVHHLETVTSSEETFDVLRSFLPNSSDNLKVKEENEGRRSVKTVNKQDQLLFKAKQTQEVLSRNARFEQIWKSRKGNPEAPEDELVHEMCRLYDVVRVDVEELKTEMREKDTDLEDCRMMAQYLPLLEEVLPAVAKDIEYNLHDCMSKQASSVPDGYVYDFYGVDKDASVTEADSANLFPLVQVDDDDEFYDGPDDSDGLSDDSNAEDNPANDYPDEDEVTSDSSDEKSEVESRTSGDQSEDSESGSDESYEYKESGPPNLSDDAIEHFGYPSYSDGDAYDHDFTDDEWM